MCYLSISPENLDSEHICCAISDRKCREGYDLKKQWLTQSFSENYSFLKLDERAKVFIEYGPAEKAWMPISAPGYLSLGCFWVSGKYKQQGHGKALLQRAFESAIKQNKEGLVAVVGRKKFHFMSDKKWLVNQGFRVCDETSDGFELLVSDLNNSKATPCFNAFAKQRDICSLDGVVVYYSHRCPFTEYHVRSSLAETINNRSFPLTVVQLKTMEEAQKAPTPATIFSLYYEGKFITTDISVCMDSRFDKILEKAI